MDVKVMPSIHLDASAFDPWKVQGFTHTLCGHPLLAPEALVSLGRRFRGTSRWYTFSSRATAGTDFDSAAAQHPASHTAVESLGAIDKADAWVLLRHIQADATYRALVDNVFDSVAGTIEAKDPGLYYRAGWIFSASPHTATPFHIDRSHVLLAQVEGTKTVYVWDPDDTDVVSARARDAFHTRHDLSRAAWSEAFRERAHVFTLSPGMGVYMPLTSPHMVETSDQSSRTISFTYNTRATRRVAALHVLRENLHAHGVKSPVPGRSRVFDRMAGLVSSALIACNGPGGKAPACPSLRKASFYAVAD